MAIARMPSGSSMPPQATETECWFRFASGAFFDEAVGHRPVGIDW
jgi:hypothetical protein